MTEKKRLFKYIGLTLGALIIAFGIVYGIWFKHILGLKAQFAKAQPPTAVASSTAKAQSWIPTLSAVGTLRASNGVDVTAEVGGKVVKIEFHSGDKVKKGDLLVQLDDSSDVAELAGLQAQEKLDAQSLQRYRSLIKKNLASQEQLDNAQTQLQRSTAAVAAKQAVIAKKALKAPFSGYLGIRQIDLGQYVSPGSAIVTLQDLDHLLVDFNLPEQYASRLKAGQDIQLSVESSPGKDFSGKITAISPKVDPSTHNVQVQAALDNSQHLLKPGMFAEVKIFAGTAQPVVTIPNTAVNYTLYGDTVFVITPKDGKDAKDGLVAKQRFIKVGEQREGQVVVIKGLKAGEQVVSAGSFKLHDGASVQINNEVDLEGQAEAGE